MEPVLRIGQESQRTTRRELRHEEMFGLHPFGQIDRTDIGTPLDLFEVEQLPRSVEQQIAFVVLLARRRIARHRKRRKAEALAGHRLGETVALSAVDAIGRHDDELDTRGRDAEDVVGHLQIDAPRHRFQQRIEPRTGFVDLRRRRAEHEVLALQQAGRDGHAAQRIGKPLVVEQLTRIEGRQDAVELPVGVGAAAAVAARDPVAREIDHGEIADYAAPQREGRPFGFVEGEIIGPRQQPQKQHEHGEAEK